jgi:polar amino acid transport system substrate-binding protein
VNGLVLILWAASVSQHAVERAGDGAVDPPPEVLTVCAVPAAMPRTGRAPDGTPRGLDVAVAQRVGRILGRTVEFHWCASAECGWHCLPEGRCHVVIGQPVDSGPPRDVAWSVPYAAAQFGLVVPEHARDVHSLADLRAKRVGVVTGTVALSEKDHAVAGFKTREELLERFGAAELNAAFVDADFAAWYLHGHPQLGLRLVTGYTPRERWNMALAVRAKDAQLLMEVNRALAQLAESGEIREIYAEHGVTLRAPFTGSAAQRETPDAWNRIRERGEMVVSVDPANLPYSSAKEDRPGFDVELARSLAQRLHLKLRIDWLDIRRETAVGELLQRRCDLVFGEAVAANAVADDQELAGKILYSRPYYRTGYVLVKRKDGPRVQTLAELKGVRSQLLGAEAGSVADYSLRQRGYLRRLYRNQLATLKALHDGDINYAYLWANVGWTLHASAEFKLEIVPLHEPDDQWNIAIAMCVGNEKLKRHVDAAIETLIADGTVAQAMDRYFVPGIGSFPEQTRNGQENLAGGTHHGVANRGLEPRMQRIESSKHPYTGLARIRSAGELVVALDQNNLPFSTAYPQPLGLDYEIAGLLAQQLGLPLRVYWALSTHDSYPSKLSAKRLCDVILGIMPDDRFGERVIYSRPYYRAQYQLVVRSGEDPPGPGGTIGLEAGVAVSGLKGRLVQTYPSTAEILEAVAAGRVRAGYVISTRGPWLAEERWPGKLVFHSGSNSVDCFPICAAVHKEDRDLKDSIDRAWDELERSGQLAKVFARWHIPHAAFVASGTKREPHS